MLGLLGCLSLQRIASAGFPVVLIVATADARGLWPAAAVQGARVFTATFTAPLRARVLDRIGRHRVIVPQTLLVAALLLLLGAAVTSRSVPLPLVLAAAIAPAALSPATDSVIRTLWRGLGQDEQQVKALHSYDSILEEAGYLAGPALASVLMLVLGPDIALFTVIGAVIAGSCLVLLSRQVRSALQPKPGAKARTLTAPPAGGRARRFARTLAGPIASRELQRIVLPLILMGSVFGVVGILAPALCARAGHSDATRVRPGRDKPGRGDRRPDLQRRENDLAAAGPPCGPRPGLRPAPALRVRGRQPVGPGRAAGPRRTGRHAPVH